MPLGTLLDGERSQVLRRQGVRIGGLPGLHMHAGDGLGVVGPAGADHDLEPTLGG